MSTQQFRAISPTKNRTRVILSGDDEPGILVSRQLILEREGYKVLSASDGEQALRMFAEQPEDLVLLDYLMPGMDGGAVAREIKRCKPGVPVIIVSGTTVKEETLTCADGFLSKAEGPTKLLQLIGRLLAPLLTMEQGEQRRRQLQLMKAFAPSRTGGARQREEFRGALCPGEFIVHCSICGKPVPPEECKTEDRGRPVHEKCYAAMTITTQQKQATAGS